MAFAPVRQKRIAAEIVGQLKAALLSGRFKPGERLPTERELTNRFRVSRVVVREALRELEITGHVRILQGPNGGAYVTGGSTDPIQRAFLDMFRYGKLSVAELIRSRRIIECETARQAARPIRSRAARRLEEALAAEREERGTHADFVSSRIEIHRILARENGNRLLEVLAGALLRLTAEVILVVKPPQQVIHRPEEHAAIVQAVVSGDPESAAEAMGRHLERMGRRLARLEGAYRRKMARAASSGSAAPPGIA